MKNILHDIRLALRLLVQNRTVTLTAMVALALGIGANTAIFSIIHAVLLTPLPYRDPARIVTLLGPGSNPIAGGDFLDLKAQAQSFEPVAAAEAWGASLTGGDHPERIVGIRLSDGMFGLLGVSAYRGRTFVSDDFLPGRQNVLVISYGLWQRRFGGDSEIIGKDVLLDGMQFKIAGVMPAGFYFSPFWITQAEMWAPLDVSGRVQDHSGRSLRVFGRMRPGVRIEAAQSEVNSICRNLARAYPENDTGLRILVEKLDEKVVGKVRPALLVIMAAVGLVLLIACANVANLVLARAAGRQREIAIRLSLGANRVRIVRQFLTENVVLALAGAIPAVLLASWGTHVLQALLQPDAGAFGVRLPRWNEIGIGGPVLLFTLGLAVATGIAFGMAPALFACKTDLNRALQEGGRAMSSGRGVIRRALVGSEVALAIILLAGAGLLMRSFLNLRAIDAGFDPHNVLTLEASTAGEPQYAGAARENLYRTIVRRIDAVPGVHSAALINHVPLVGDVWGFNFAVEGRPLRPGQEPNAVYRVAGPDYFATMKIPVLKGREFSDHDNAAAPLVAIVNEKLAGGQWPNENPIGKRIAVEDIRHDPKWRIVVGVVKNVKQDAWVTPAQDEVYIPLWQAPDLLESKAAFRSYISVVTRTDLEAGTLTHAVQNAVWEIDRNLAISRVVTLEHAISNSTWQWRFNLLLIGTFSAMAITLAVVGIYGVMAYEVAQRSHEIGIRVALGANRASITRLVLAQMLGIVLAGVAGGILAAVALARMMAGLLYGVGPADPATFAGVAILAAGVAVAACLAPARRASAIDPAVALRHS